MARPREFDEDEALDRCMETFWSGTYASVSTDALCEATGLSRSSFYNTFKGKSEVYRRALARYGELRERDRARYLDTECTGREAIESVARELLAGQWASPQRRTCLVLHAAADVDPADAEAKALLRRHLGSFRGMLADLVTRGQLDGSISSSLPADDLAAMIHASLNGLQVTDRVAASPDEATGVVATLLACLSG